MKRGSYMEQQNEYMNMYSPLQRHSPKRANGTGGQHQIFTNPSDPGQASGFSNQKAILPKPYQSKAPIGAGPYSSIEKSPAPSGVKSKLAPPIQSSRHSSNLRSNPGYSS